MWEKCSRMEVKLRGVRFLCHAKPKDAEQAAVWKKLVEDTLEPLSTGKVVLSAGKDKREKFKQSLPHLSEMQRGAVGFPRRLFF